MAVRGMRVLTQLIPVAVAVAVAQAKLVVMLPLARQ